MSFGARFGQLVRRYRENDGISAKKLALDAFGDEAKGSRISEIENGRVANPQAKTISKLCEALGISDEEVETCRQPAGDSKTLADPGQSRKEHGSFADALNTLRDLSRSQLDMLARRFDIEEPGKLKDSEIVSLLEKKAEEYRQYKAQFEQRVAGLGNLKAVTKDALPDVRIVGGAPTRSSERLLPDNQSAVGDASAVKAQTADVQPDPVTLEPAASRGVPGAQTAILYEEGLTPEANGFTAPGRMLWSLDETGPSPVIIGTVGVPARGITLNVRISLNQDAALPATHLIEFAFQFSEAFPAKGVTELVGVVIKPEEKSRGDPLRGAIVDLGNGVFWQALAAGGADRAVNMLLLRDGEWFDLPLLYSDNRRVIITFEKGQNGAKVFARALNAWSAQ